MTAVLTVPFLPAITSDLRRWEAAAAVRRTILEERAIKSRAPGARVRP